ncbi:MAG: LPS-assembly protein LptD [Pseudomonadota bacterium]
MALLLGFTALQPEFSFAQESEQPAFFELSEVDDDEEMLVEAAELIYDNEADTVTARGNVQIYYGPYTLQADEVVYDRQTFRVRAKGNVRVTEPDGNVLFAEAADMSDDFRDGFIRSLTVETPEHTYISAATAERSANNTTVFNRGVYTACPQCEDNPQKPPLWQVKAVRIIHDQEARMIYYENVRLEFLGIPLAWIPFLSNPDPSVDRKTGLLTPRFRYSDLAGFGVQVPYFINIAPNMDVTLSPTAFTRQGLLLEGEFRHRTENGSYSISGAGIHQLMPDDTPDNPGDDADWRGYVTTSGRFAINKYWQYGWDGTLVSDRGFLDVYNIDDATRLTSQLFLEGQSDRNSFEARAYYFERLNVFGANNPQSTNFDQSELPFVLPTIDYNYVADRDIFGGELGFSISTYVTHRGDVNSDVLKDNTLLDRATADEYADAARLSAEVYWRRTLTDPIGQVFTPFASARVDAQRTTEGYNAGRTTQLFDADTGYDEWMPAFTEDETLSRFIPTVGIEYRYPWVASGSLGVHVFEPIAQLYYRPDVHSDEDTFLNEDAISLVFDAASLFDRDKFSGQDRVETGLRANVGLRYTGAFSNGMTAEFTIGQSYHLAGDNPFPEDSGLEDTTSDIVAEADLNFPRYLSFSSSVRVDPESLDLERASVSARVQVNRITAAAQYAVVRDQPGLDLSTSGDAGRSEQLKGAAQLALTKNWSLAGSARYDIADAELDSRSLSLHYGDECFTFGLGVTESFDSNGDLSRSVSLRFTLRTLGGFSASSATLDFLEEDPI